MRCRGEVLFGRDPAFPVAGSALRMRYRQYFYAVLGFSEHQIIRKAPQQDSSGSRSEKRKLLRRFADSLNYA